MAFASVGSLGSMQSKAGNAATIVITTTAALEADNLGVALFSFDSTAAAGDESGVTGVTDSGGNTWTKAGEFCSGLGSTISIWFCRVSSQVNNGGTITASLTNSADRDAVSATAWEFTVADVVSKEGTPTTEATATDVGSLNVTTANIECLRVRGITGEQPQPGGQLASVTSGWTAFDPNGTTGGGAASNNSVCGEFRISTGTGDASDPAMLFGTLDKGSIYIALKEGAPPPPSGLHRMLLVF